MGKSKAANKKAVKVQAKKLGGATVIHVKVGKTPVRKAKTDDESVLKSLATKKAIPDQIRDMIEQGELPTQADKDRQKKAATEKARKKMLELPNTPADELILKTTKLNPAAKIMRHHTKAGWSCCLMWLEQGEREGVTHLAKIHAIVQDDNTGALVYEKYRPDELPHFAEIQGGYPVGPAITAFKHHADVNGASKEVRELLGLPAQAPPQMEKVIVRDETDGRPTGEIKLVPKKNANRDPSSAELSKDIEELYTRAAKLLDIKLSDLKDKYKHLNPGLQAMNLRNRLRAKGHTV